MSGTFAVSYFLITLFFSLLLFVLWARIFLRFAKISTLNPMSRLIYTVTDVLVKPIDGLVSPKKPQLRRYDGACFIALVLVEFVKFIVLSFLFYGALMPVSYLLLFVFADLVVQPCNLLFYLILIRVVMHYMNPDWKTPFAEVIYKVTEPVLSYGRCVIPNISGFDFSPFIILLVLKVVTIFMTASLPLKLI
ncbi:MAG: YggT family protein [Tatlockia sp.]|jgi:YggT family protein